MKGAIACQTFELNPYLRHNPPSKTILFIMATKILELVAKLEPKSPA